MKFLRIILFTPANYHHVYVYAYGLVSPTNITTHASHKTTKTLFISGLRFFSPAHRLISVFFLEISFCASHMITFIARTHRFRFCFSSLFFCYLFLFFIFIFIFIKRSFHFNRHCNRMAKCCERLHNKIN